MSRKLEKFVIGGGPWPRDAEELAFPRATYLEANSVGADETVPIIVLDSECIYQIWIPDLGIKIWSWWISLGMSWIITNIEAERKVGNPSKGRQLLAIYMEFWFLFNFDSASWVLCGQPEEI